MAPAVIVQTSKTKDEGWRTVEDGQSYRALKNGGKVRRCYGLLYEKV